MSSVPPPNWEPTSIPAPEAPGQPGGATRGRSRTLAGVAAVLALAGGVFALLGSSATRLTDPVAEAATVSSDAGGYRARISMEFNASGMTGPVSAVGSGTFDARDHAGAMTVAMNLGSNPGLGSGTLRMREIIDGTTVYMRLLGGASGALGALGQRWIKLDVAKAFRLPGLSSIEGNPEATDPSQALQYLRAVSGSVVAEGRQRVDGFKTTHYRADVNLDSVPQALNPIDQPAAQQTIATLEETTGLHTIPIDAWVDSGHLVRRLRERLDTTLASGQVVEMSMTLDMSDYGPQPQPAVPSGGDVQDITSLVGAAGQ